MSLNQMPGALAAEARALLHERDARLKALHKVQAWQIMQLTAFILLVSPSCPWSLHKSVFLTIVPVSELLCIEWNALRVLYTTWLRRRLKDCTVQQQLDMLSQEARVFWLGRRLPAIIRTPAQKVVVILQTRAVSQPATGMICGISKAV